MPPLGGGPWYFPVDSYTEGVVWKTTQSYVQSFINAFYGKYEYVIHAIIVTLHRPKSHLLYGKDTAAVRPLNWQKRAAAAVFLRWPQGGPTSYSYILQAVGVAVEL